MNLYSESNLYASFISHKDSNTSDLNIASVHNWCKLDNESPSTALPRFHFLETSEIKFRPMDSSDPLKYFLTVFDS